MYITIGTVLRDTPHIHTATTECQFVKNSTCYERNVSDPFFWGVKTPVLTHRTPRFSFTMQIIQKDTVSSLKQNLFICRVHVSRFTASFVCRATTWQSLKMWKLLVLSFLSCLSVVISSQVCLFMWGTKDFHWNFSLENDQENSPVFDYNFSRGSSHQDETLFYRAASLNPLDLNLITRN